MSEGACYRLGLDIGGTKTQGVLVAPDGSVVATAVRPTELGVQVVETAEAVRESCERKAGATAEFVGVGIPGVVAAGGVVLHAANLGIRKLALGELLAKRFGVPVAVNNDVKAAVLGARRMLDDPPDLAYINFGTGVSAAYLLGGQLVAGSGNVAGEIGHLVAEPLGEECPCGQRGCVETLAGGRGIGRRLAELEPPVGLANLVDAADAGHPGARAEVARIVAGVAFAVQTLALTLDPPRIVLGGGVIRAGNGLVAEVRAELDRRSLSSGFLRMLDLPGRLVTLDPELPVGAYGAALLAEAPTKRGLGADPLVRPLVVGPGPSTTGRRG